MHIPRTQWSEIEWDKFAGMWQADLERCTDKAEEARIRSDLTVATFFQNNFSETLSHANRCHELSQEFKEPERYINVLYLESAVYLTQVEKQPDQLKLALKTATLAAELFASKGLADQYLKGDIYFILGTIQELGSNLQEALDTYKISLAAFMAIHAGFRCMAVQIKIGKISRKLGLPVEFIHIKMGEGQQQVRKLGEFSQQSLLQEEGRSRSKKCCVML